VQKIQRKNIDPGPHQGQHLSNRQHEEHQVLNRESEPERVFFRCGRYFTVGHEWYATTREGRDIGPCATRHEAEMSLAFHLSDRAFGISGQLGQLVAHGERDATVLEVRVQELTSCLEQTRLRNENSAYVWAKQRLDKFEKHPTQHDHADIRANVLRHFLSELDS